MAGYGTGGYGKGGYGVGESAYADAVLADAPLGYYRLGEASGTTMTDSSGSARNGVYGGTPVLGAASLLAGDTDTSVDFNGSSHYGTVDPRPVAFDTTRITVEAIIHPEALAASTAYSILDRDQSGRSRIFQFRMNGQKVEFIFWTAGGGPFFVLGATALAVATTYHVAATFDGATARVYVNGVEDGSLAQAGDLKTGEDIFSVARNMSAGGTGAQFFNGRIDEAALYGTALTATRIKAHYDAAVGATTSVTEVTGALSGSGSLTAAVTEIETATGGLTGSGTLTATAVEPVTVSAGLSGSGTLTATAVDAAGAVEVTGALTGSGTLTATTAELVTRSGALSGDGTLTGTAVQPVTVSAGLAGEGTLTGTAVQPVTVSAGLSGSGTLTATAAELIIITRTGALSGDGTATGLALRVISISAGLTGYGLAQGEAWVYVPITYQPYLGILDESLDRAPGVLTVVATEGRPDQLVEFLINGVVVSQLNLDSEGGLGPTSIPVPETLLAGTHTLSLRVAGSSQADTVLGTSGTFTIKHNPDPAPYAIDPDADPVAVPAAVTTDVRRWVLQDLLPGGLGSYVFPHNPSAAAPMPFTRSLDQQRTISPTGKYHVFEPLDETHLWSFSGTYETAEFHQKLLAYSKVNRRLYLIDHRNRAWTIAFLGVDLIPRTRVRDFATGVDSDDYGTYTARVLLYSSRSKVPA